MQEKKSLVARKKILLLGKKLVARKKNLAARKKIVVLSQEEKMPWHQKSLFLYEF